MNIYVWSNFTKRKNSTKQPTSGTLISCVLKEDTSIENPSFILNTPIADYTYVQAFDHYYFVTDVINLDAHRCELVCTMDVLATYKSDITSYTAFVERSASNYDPYISDPLLSAKQMLIGELDTNTSMPAFFGAGCFVSQVLAKDNGITLYLTPDLTIFKQLLIPSVYQSSDILDWIDSKIAQAFDLDVYIGSVKWMPFNINNIGTPYTSHFYVGPVDVGVPAGYNLKILAQDFTITSTKALNLPTTGAFNDFRDCSPRFTQYTVFLPGVGIIDLDPAIIGYCIHNSVTVNVNMYCDLVSGDMTYILTYGNDNGKIGRYTGNVSVNVPIGKSVADLGKTAGLFAGSVAAGAQVGGAIGAAIGAVVGAVEAIGNELTPSTTMIGGSGNKSELEHTRGYMHVTRKQFGAKDYPTDVAGRPLMQNVALSTLSGYVKCGNASVPVNCHDSERDAINNYLNSGFYIE